MFGARKTSGSKKSDSRSSWIPWPSNEDAGASSSEMEDHSSISSTEYVWATTDTMKVYASDVMAQLASPFKSYLGSGDDHQTQRIIDKLPSQDSDSKTLGRQQSLLTGPALTNLFRNPYVSIRGGRQNQAQPHISLDAVRSLLNTVPSGASNFEGDDASNDSSRVASHSDNLSWVTGASARQHRAPASSSSETASQLAEGTLRAYRDLALDEAVELHEALRFWSYRWERPLLSWLEAGPRVWFSDAGYQHRVVGQKVTQIQAVLVRRCASIGELQQHLLRSGWQRGVSDWGVLGDGGEWAAVTAFDGSMQEQSEPHVGRGLASGRFQRVSSELSEMHLPRNDTLPTGAPQSNISKLPSHAGHHNALYYADIFVRKQHDGKIHIDDPALAEWSVDAISLVRQQLYRASNGTVPLPFNDNWERGYAAGGIQDSQDDNKIWESEQSETIVPKGSTRRKPSWASLPDIGSMHALDESLESIPENPRETRAHICDLQLMAREVGSLLDVMEDVISMQRARRLDKLKAPNWMRRNWYMTAVGIPSMVFLFMKLSENGYGFKFLKFTSSQVVTFFQEHVNAPIVAIFNELFKGPDNISDRDARNVVVANLKLMIRSWLDENYPTMDEIERAYRANSMDMSLIEGKKAESVKTFYEINNVIRMSFIEAQFLKKEMMNALVAMDDMQASNNMNMNLAAVTPAVLLVYGAQRVLRFVRYALLKLGKSKEEIYRSFQHGLLEMERLIVMRDNPPLLDHNGGTWIAGDDNNSPSQTTDGVFLNSDDLGMLMLHIHELRTILWRARSRFSADVIRSVAEDLAELAGERGAVRVKQQIQIISRMARTYPFLSYKR